MKTIQVRARQLNGLWEKSKGLISREPEPVFFTTRWGIHTFGVRAALDVVILDDTLRVISVITLPPDRVFFWNPKYSNVLELPAGTISLKTGDRIILSARP